MLDGTAEFLLAEFHQQVMDIGEYEPSSRFRTGELPDQALESPESGLMVRARANSARILNWGLESRGNHCARSVLPKRVMVFGGAGGLRSRADGFPIADRMDRFMAMP